jgi:L-amino acid N-acyltransferase YncA
MRFELRPISRDAANAFIERLHRHRGRVVAHLFALAALTDGEMVGVVIVGRPLARGLCDGFTAEVTRLCTNGAQNACSYLYAAAWRAARALGYRRLVTYTLASESGVSLRAAGWIPEASVKGRSWSCASRPRTDAHPIEDKVRWRAA